LAGSGIAGLKNTNSFSFPGVSVTSWHLGHLHQPSIPGPGSIKGRRGVARSPYPGALTDDRRNYLVAQANDTVICPSQPADHVRPAVGIGRHLQRRLLRPERDTDHPGRAISPTSSPTERRMPT
jgi:hypothetical protein